MLARAGSWVGNTIGGLTLARFWLYQDYPAGSGPNLTLTDNDNGTGLVFDSSRVVDGSAVATKTTGEPIFSNTAELPSQLITANNTGDAVTLSDTPDVGEGTVRIWYLYSMSSETAPSDIEIAPHFVQDTRSAFLDTRFLNADLNLSDLTNTSTARTNLGFVAQTAGNVLLGDGGTTFTSSANLFFDSGSAELGIGTNTPDQRLHVRNDAASAVALIESQFTTAVPELRLQLARTSNADLANGDDVGMLSFYGRMNATTSELARVFAEYTGNGTTQTADLVFYTSNAGAPAEALRITAAGAIDTILGAGAVQSDASGILSSGTLGVTYGGTGTATQFTQGSVVFAGASGVYSQDNTNFFWDDTLDQLALGPTASTGNYRFIIEPSTDSFGYGFALEGTGAGASRTWEIFPAASGFLYFRNPGATLAPLTFDNVGRVGIENQSPAAGLHIRNEANRTGDPSTRISAVATQTGDLLQFYSASDAAKLAHVEVDGDAFFPNLTLSNSLVLEDPGAGSNTITMQAGTVSASYSITWPTAQATAADQVLTNDGSGVLSWAAAKNNKGGTISLSQDQTSQAVTFATAFGSTNYTPVVSFKNTVDGDPVYIPYTIIAHASSGFTVEWNEGLATGNYVLLWGIIEHYDP